MRERMRAAGDVALGFALIVLCFYGGVEIKRLLHLLLPGNVLGLFLMLALLGTGILPIRRIERAGQGMIFILPLLFVPIYVYAGHDGELWRRWGVVLVAVLVGAVAAMWIAVALVAGKILRKEGE